MGVHIAGMQGQHAEAWGTVPSMKPNKPSSSPYLRAGALPDADDAVLVRVEHLANLQAHVTAVCTRQ